MPVYRQSSFIGGMLSPSLEGRTDYDKRLAGARRIHNFFVTPYGTLRRRPGVRFMANAYGSGSLFGSGGLPDVAGSGETKNINAILPSVRSSGIEALWRNTTFIAGNTMQIHVHATGLAVSRRTFTWRPTVQNFIELMIANPTGYTHQWVGDDGKVLNIWFLFSAGLPSQVWTEVANGVPIRFLEARVWGAPGQSRVNVQSLSLDTDAEAITPDPDPEVDPADIDLRYIPFRGHDNTDTLLVLGHLLGRAIINGDAATAKQFAHPWKGRDLRPDPQNTRKPGIKWSQSGGRLLITHPDYEPMYLVAPATEAEDWTVKSGTQPVTSPDLNTFSADYNKATGG